MPASDAALDAAIRDEVAHNLAVVRGRIAEAARRHERDAEDVTLIAVSKTQPPERVRAALEAGQRVFGENRVQEAESRWPPLRAAFPHTVLHLIGSLQTNKARAAVELFDSIQTLDRPALATALAAAMDKVGRRPDCYVQVNTGEEAQKGGVIPAEADAFIAACREVHELPVVGLMCIPPADDVPAPHFALLDEIARRNGLTRLSMGMSGDYEIAVQLGATAVRVGTAIFGSRAPARG